MVDPAAVDELIGAISPDLPITGCRLRLGAGLVAVEVGRLQLAQGQLREGEATTELHHLTADAFAPERLVANERPGGSGAVLPVDLVNGRCANRGPFMLNDPE